MTQTIDQIKKRIGRNVREDAPKISVVIPAYNSAGLIGATLESVFAQTFRDYEVIVVNDGSPDTESLEIAIKPFIEQISYITRQNSGAGVARNTGIEIARGEIIAFLDADDIWQPDYLTSQYEFLMAGGYGMVYCDAALFGSQSVTGKTFMEQSPSEGEADVDALLELRCNVITSGTLARKSVIQKAGMFEVERTRSEDFHLWVRIANSGSRIGYQRQVLLRYRVSPDGLSGDAINRIERAIDVFRRLSCMVGMNAKQQIIIKRGIAGFEADLGVETGKAFLLAGSFTQARTAFDQANRLRPSAKLTIVGLLCLMAPRMLRKFYIAKNPAALDFIPKLDSSASAN